MARVLIVDDVKDVRDLLAQIVEMGGYQTLLASGGAEALEVIESDRPDLVLLDISMPGMDGMQVLRTLRAAEDTRDLPIFMMTAMADEHTRDRALNLGADGYFVKGDFDIDTMLDTLKQRLAA